LRNAAALTIRILRRESPGSRIRARIRVSGRPAAPADTAIAQYRSWR